VKDFFKIGEQLATLQAQCLIVFYAFMPLTVILIIIYFLSPTLSFIPDLNLPFLQIIPTAAFLFLLQDWLHDSPDFYCYFRAYPFLLSTFSVLHFLVVVSVRYIKLTHVGFRAHVKIASRIVSYSLLRAMCGSSRCSSGLWQASDWTDRQRDRQRDGEETKERW